MTTLSKDNADRIRALLRANEEGTAALHPSALKRYQELLATAEVKRGPGRPKKEPEPTPPPHDDYVPVEGADPAVET